MAIDTTHAGEAAASAAIVDEGRSSAVSWSAIGGGALAAAGTSLILLTLGSGMGLAAISPWAGLSATVIGTTAAIWMVVVQWLSSAFGGYIAGRLRTSWVGLHTHEVAFRDTAHGVLAWALASILAAVVLTIAAGAIATNGQHLASGAQTTSSSGGGVYGEPVAYLTDSLFRSDHEVLPSAEVRIEASRILLTGFGKSGISDADKSYLARIVAANTGLASADAAKRVDDITAQIKIQVEAARKAASFGAFMMALSLLVGAFIAGVAGAFGGLQRDHYRDNPTRADW